jgi:hypothetical protein
MNLSFLWKMGVPIARKVLQLILASLGTITEDEINEAADYINGKIGGNKRFEAMSLKILIQAAIFALDVIKI